MKLFHSSLGDEARVCNSTSVSHVERPDLLSSPESGVESAYEDWVTRPLDIVCDADRDRF